MNNIVDFRQRVRMCLPVFAASSVFFSPLYSIIMFAAVLIAILFSIPRRRLLIIVATICALDVLAALLLPDTVSHAIPPGPRNWILYPSSVRLLPCVFTTMGLAWVGTETADDILLRSERKRRERQYIHTDVVDTDNRTHLFVAGTTGSGKTTLLLQYVEASIASGEALYVLSGKNGTDDKRSLLNVTKALARKYGREMVIVSLNTREQERRKYNPLAAMSPTELSDALTSISDYTEPHYKACTATWVKALCEVLTIAGIPLSLASVCDFYTYDNFNTLVMKLKKDGKLSAAQANSYTALKDVAQEAGLSRSRYQNLLYGDGADLFGSGTDEYVNASTAKTNGAVFFVDLDSFRYSDYTQAVGKLFISDIRHVISQEQDMFARKRIIMDELGSYATEMLMPLFAQARSYGYQIIVATQSIADLSAVSDTFAERVMENCGQYGILQLNSAQDAETMANIIGTQLTVETTRKTSGVLLDSGAAGTKKLVREYKVPPDDIKELPQLTAIYYDKHCPDSVYIVHVPFVTI